MSHQILERLVRHVREHGHREMITVIGRTLPLYCNDPGLYGIVSLESEEWPSGYFCATIVTSRQPIDGEACVVAVGRKGCWEDWDGGDV
jgi:hypothetical protein